MSNSDAESFEENLEGSAESDAPVASGFRPHKRRHLNESSNRVPHDDEDNETDDPNYEDLYEQAQHDPIDVDATQSAPFNSSEDISNPIVIPSTQVAIDPALVQSYADADAEVIEIPGLGDVLDVEGEEETEISRDASTEVGNTPQTAVEIPDEEPISREHHGFRRARDYKCPICFDTPEVALYTPCGHIFCIECIFEMINSVKANRRVGQCALCRRDVSLGKIKLLKLRKKRVPKDS
ncbi:SUMO-targeted ubiquitin ligase complex subunit SLX8 LALA0_S01e06128g [Lachancea lanzarotensis]|uniref:LALA0S01e06128g1_1 n=1 Tax=Lachancea lanzarotensis TaxID=1245769 RepID=A0A0C7N137_9SACH|nr:uncharacterized protein LALA0_S01e06128g [Lachancea lanzarotensis]CEP60237.1 LALA0S01e06128g1_1 [Lachancea lanzarotensis]